jgi:hypothetical protein
MALFDALGFQWNRESITRRDARENWRRSYHDKREEQLGPQASSSNERDTEIEKTQPERDSGLDFDPER